MRPLLHQSGDHSAQRQQRLVDVSRLASSLVHSAGTADVLAAGEIDLNRKRLGHFRRCRLRPSSPPPPYRQIITRLSFPIFTSSSPSRAISFMWMVTENTEWERLWRNGTRVSKHNRHGGWRRSESVFLRAGTWNRRS